MTRALSKKYSLKATSPINKDCCLIIDAVSIRKQTLLNTEKDQYSLFVDLGDAMPNFKSEKLAFEALVFWLEQKITGNVPLDIFSR